MPQTNTNKNYYDILGVSEDADEEEIRKAYRKKAQKWHPDRSDHPDAEEKFKEIGEAYAVLKDSEKRQQYDQFRQYGRAPGDQGFQFDAEGFDFFDLFRQAAGAAGGPGGGRRGGRGQGGTRSVGFEDLFSGGGGRQQTWQSPPGGARRTSPRDGGRRSREEEVTRRIPLKLAALGGKLKLRTPSGELVKVTIEPGTQPGTRLRIPNKGTGGRDVVVNLEVKVPTDLSEEQKETLREHF